MDVEDTSRLAYYSRDGTIMVRLPDIGGVEREATPCPVSENIAQVSPSPVVGKNVPEGHTSKENAIEDPAEHSSNERAESVLGSGAHSADVSESDSKGLAIPVKEEPLDSLEMPETFDTVNGGFGDLSTSEQDVSELVDVPSAPCGDQNEPVDTLSEITSPSIAVEKDSFSGDSNVFSNIAQQVHAPLPRCLASEGFAPTQAPRPVPESSIQARAECILRSNVKVLSQDDVRKLAPHMPETSLTEIMSITELILEANVKRYKVSYQKSRESLQDTSVSDHSTFIVACSHIVRQIRRVHGVENSSCRLQSGVIEVTTVPYTQESVEKSHALYIWAPHKIGSELYILDLNNYKYIDIDFIEGQPSVQIVRKSLLPITEHVIGRSALSMSVKLVVQKYLLQCMSPASVSVEILRKPKAAMSKPQKRKEKSAGDETGAKSKKPRKRRQKAGESGTGVVGGIRTTATIRQYPFAADATVSESPAQYTNIKSEPLGPNSPHLASESGVTNFGDGSADANSQLPTTVVSLGSQTCSELDLDPLSCAKAEIQFNFKKKRKPHKKKQKPPRLEPSLNSPTLDSNEDQAATVSCYPNGMASASGTTNGSLENAASASRLASSSETEGAPSFQIGDATRAEIQNISGAKLSEDFMKKLSKEVSQFVSGSNSVFNVDSVSTEGQDGNRPSRPKALVVRVMPCNQLRGGRPIMKRKPNSSPHVRIVKSRKQIKDFLNSVDSTPDTPPNVCNRFNKSSSSVAKVVKATNAFGTNFLHAADTNTSTSSVALVSNVAPKVSSEKSGRAVSSPTSISIKREPEDEVGTTSVRFRGSEPSANITIQNPASDSIRPMVEDTVQSASVGISAAEANLNRFRAHLDEVFESLDAGLCEQQADFSVHNVRIESSPDIRIKSEPQDDCASLSDGSTMSGGVENAFRTNSMVLLSSSGTQLNSREESVSNERAEIAFDSAPAMNDFDPEPRMAVIEKRVEETSDMCDLNGSFSSVDQTSEPQAEITFTSTAANRTCKTARVETVFSSSPVHKTSEPRAEIAFSSATVHEPHAEVELSSASVRNSEPRAEIAFSSAIVHQTHEPHAEVVPNSATFQNSEPRAEIAFTQSAGSPPVELANARRSGSDGADTSSKKQPLVAFFNQGLREKLSQSIQLCKSTKQPISISLPAGFKLPQNIGHVTTKPRDDQNKDSSLPQILEVHSENLSAYSGDELWNRIVGSNTNKTSNAEVQIKTEPLSETVDSDSDDEGALLRGEPVRFPPKSAALRVPLDSVPQKRKFFKSGPRNSKPKFNASKFITAEINAKASHFDIRSPEESTHVSLQRLRNSKSVPSVKKERGYACTLPGGAGFRKVGLQRDLKSVSAPTNFACDVCGQSFKFSMLLRKHMRIHNEYHCDICNIDLPSQAVYDAHIATFHPVFTEADVKTEPESPQNEDLERHFSIVDGESEEIRDDLEWEKCFEENGIAIPSTLNRAGIRDDEVDRNSDAGNGSDQVEEDVYGALERPHEPTEEEWAKIVNG